MKGRNKIAPLFLLLTAMPYAMLMLLLWQQWQARNAMEEKLEHAQLITIHLHRNKIHWIVNNRELQLGDDMFDVKHLEQQGDTLVLQGLFDHEEKKIRSQVQRLAQKQRETSSKPIAGFFTILHGLYIEPAMPQKDPHISWCRVYHNPPDQAWENAARPVPLQPPRG